MRREGVSSFISKWIVSISISVDDQLQVERIKFRKGTQQLLRKKKSIIQKAVITLRLTSANKERGNTQSS